MEILDYLFEKSKPPVDESDIPDEKTLLADMEAIRAMLTFTHWEGEPRELSTMRISYQSPDWSATLSDPDNRRSLTATGRSVQEAVESLNKYLIERVGRWYYWPGKNGASGAGKSTISSKPSGARTVRGSKQK